jgi:hypothetical protein
VKGPACVVPNQKDVLSAGVDPFVPFKVASVEVIAVADWVVGLLVTEVAAKFAVTEMFPATVVSVLGFVVDESLQFMKE